MSNYKFIVQYKIDSSLDQKILKDLIYDYKQVKSLPDAIKILNDLIIEFGQYSINYFNISIKYEPTL